MTAIKEERSAAHFAALNPPRRYLFGPGPSMVHPRVYEALSKPIVGHLDPYFIQVMADVQQLLKSAFGTKDGVTLVISGTGSAGMEAAVANFVEPGAKIAVFANGYFSDRLTEMAKRHGADVVRFEKAWGETYTEAEAREFIHREKPKVVAYVHAETSTGALQSGKAICAAAHEVGALVIADCVTSLGGVPVQFDQTGIDIAYSCTQKGLGCPPGLSPMTVSPRALERLRKRATSPSAWYLDLLLLETYYMGRKYHHTASASMFYALREGLALAAEEGIENRWERHRRNHLAFVAGIEAMGLSMHVPEGHRLWTLNTPRVPEGIDDARVRKYLLEKFNMEIAGGLGAMAGKVLRIGLMGYGSTAENALLVLECLEAALRDQGYAPSGDARAAAEKSLVAVTRG